jgi:hypothetical protein
VFEDVMHVPPLQQPFGQLVESQVQTPFTQCVPLLHEVLHPPQ